MPTSTIYTAVAIFIAANLIVCIKADGNSIENSQKTKANVAPLPQKFSPELRELLSPDVFTQTDPFNYLRQKVITMKLKYRAMDNMNWDLCQGRFPTIYLPYVKLLRSLLYCLARLNNMKIFINSYKVSSTSAPRQPRPNTSTLDHELSTLFSSDIFLDSDPPSVLLDKLIALPETRLSGIGKELRVSEDPVVKYYFWYSRNLSMYLENKDYINVLKDLQRAIAEIQQLNSSPPEIGQSDQK